VKNKWLVLIGIVGLVLIYVFQMELFYDPLNSFRFNPKNPQSPEIDAWKLVFSKTIRYILNDSFALLVIWGLFENKKYMKFAVAIFMIGFLVLLPVYLFLVTNFYLETQSFLNHLHRLVLNPALIMLLIPAFYYQQSLRKKAGN